MHMYMAYLLKSCLTVSKKQIDTLAANTGKP